MALNAGTVWEIRTAGNSYNGGGYYDRGGASTDYSQQNGAQLTKTDFATDVAGTELSTVGNNFTAAMVGNIVQLWTAGPGALIGFFEIIAFIDAGHVTLDRNAGSGLSNLYGNVGGAMHYLGEIDNVMVSGNTVHIKAGTYIEPGAILTTGGSVTVHPTIEGYNATRGDDPTGSDRPLIQMGANAFSLGAYTLFKNFRFTTQHTNGLLVNGGCNLFNVEVRNDGAATRYGIYCGVGCGFFDCDVRSDNGEAFHNSNYCTFVACHIHDSDKGVVSVGGYNNFVHCIVEGNTTYGIALGSADSSNLFFCNTIHGNGTGIYVNTTSSFNKIFNNQITSNTTGLDGGSDPIRGHFIDYNNWHGNTADIGNTTPKGPHATANDPGYATPGSDFSDVDDANAFGIRLGVG